MKRQAEGDYLYLLIKLIMMGGFASLAPFVNYIYVYSVRLMQ